MQTENKEEAGWLLVILNQRPHFVDEDDTAVLNILVEKAQSITPCKGPRYGLPGLRCVTDAFGQKVLLPSPFSPPPSLNYRD